VDCEVVVPPPQLLSARITIEASTES